MKFKCRLFSVSGIPASDGSIINSDVLLRYLDSPEYERAIENRTMLGSLTHRLRNLDNAPAEIKTGSLNKTIGKDDLVVFTPEVGSPTHYISRLYIEDGWCIADCTVLSEEGMDEKGKEYIRRLTGLLNQGIKPGVSAVVLAMWSSQAGTGTDVCKRIVAIKGLDITQNPSWKDAGVVSTYNDYEERIYSECESSPEGVKVKTFSNTDALLEPGMTRSSKIDGQFCVLKAKQYSNFSPTVINPENTEKEKIFSVATIKERVRYAKLNPRQRFRRLILEYRQAVRTMGGVDKMDEETLKVMKSLFSTDILEIMRAITPDIIAGKPINTLIGASSLGKNVRIAAQKLQLPLKMALQQSQKQGYVTKNIYEKLQGLYIEFINSLTEEVFSNSSTLPELKEEEIIEEK